MKNYNALSFTTALLLIAFLSSCDPVVDYEKAIVNSSATELFLVRSNPIPFDEQDKNYSESILLDSVLLNPNARQLLMEGFDIGGSVEAYKDCPGLNEDDTIFVFTKSGVEKQLVLSITKNDFAGKHREPSKNRCECVLEITDEMLEK